MRLRIYQIDHDKDVNDLSFMPYKKIDKVDPGIYRKVFDAEADVKSLEEAFQLFNTKGHPLHNGRSMSVSDVIVTKDGAFYCDSIGFTETEFDESKVDLSDQIKVLYVEPHKKPFEAEIPDTLTAKQKAVGGFIEFVYNTDEIAQDNEVVEETTAETEATVQETEVALPVETTIVPDYSEYATEETTTVIVEDEDLVTSDPTEQGYRCLPVPE